MATIFHENRFKLSANGVLVSDQFNASCAEGIAAGAHAATAAVAQLPPPATAAAAATVVQPSALSPAVAAAASVDARASAVVDDDAAAVTHLVGAPDDAATTGATIVKSQIRSVNVTQAHTDLGGGGPPEVDILINNVVCSFSLGCHLNLRQIALNGHNVEYRRENGMVTMKLRKPQITASVWSSGKITCTGATSEEQARSGARRVARVIQRLGFDAKFRKMRVVNVLGCCSMPFEIKINAFSQRYREADYEPELHPGVTYKLADLKATLKIFSTGSITVTAPSVRNVQQAIEHIYPLVSEFRKELSASADELHTRKRMLAQQRLAASHNQPLLQQQPAQALPSQQHHHHNHHHPPHQVQLQQQQQQPLNHQPHHQPLQPLHQNHHQLVGSGFSPPPPPLLSNVDGIAPGDDENVSSSCKRKRLSSNNSCSSNDDEDKEVESIMSC